MCLLKILRILNCFILKLSVAAHYICIIINLTSFMWDLNSDDLFYISLKEIDFLFSLKINVLWESFVWERFVNTSNQDFFWVYTKVV